jgi:crotonobetainyl-CoA:carnitine CoA-transferase CaiB-like acyl-CoA transferase
VLAGGTPPPQTDRLKPPNALASVYRTADDRWIILAFVNEDKEVPLFLRALGHPEAAADPRFVDSASRHAHSADIVGLLDAEFATRSLAQWREILTSAGLTYGVVQTLDEIARDPQLIANQILVPIDDGNAEPQLTIDTAT